MKVEKINNYLTIYSECSEEELKEVCLCLHDFSNDEVDMSVEGPIFMIAYYDLHKTQFVINCGNDIYKMIEVKSGKYVEDDILGMYMIQTKEGLYDVDDITEVELEFDSFIEMIKTYMAVCCNSTSDEIENAIKNYTIANNHNSCVVSIDSRYEFSDGLVTIKGEMAKYSIRY